MSRTSFVPALTRRIASETSSSMGGETCLPRMSGIAQNEHGLEPELCSLLVGVGVPLCLITVPLWAKLLELLGI